MSVRRFEVAASILVGGEQRTLTKNYECQPKGYACYGGGWYPQFEPQGLAFHISLPEGEVRLPTPMCESSYGAGTELAELKEWPVAERVVGGDKYLYNAQELQQDSAEKVAGVRVVRYTIRRQSE